MKPLTWQRLPATALVHDREVQSAWDSLNLQRQSLPFMCAEVVAAALAIFGTGKEQLFSASVLGKPVAMFVLVPDGAMRWRTFQPSQMPLGTWVAVVDVELHGICRSLMRGPLGLCMVLSITQVDPLLAPRCEDKADSLHIDYIDTAWLEIRGEFNDYWAARGKNLRQNLRKQRSRILADGTAVQLRVFHGVEDMAPALARYGALEGKGWKAGEGTAIEADNEQGRFYTRLFESAATRGEAFISEYLLNGETAAMNLALLRDGVLVVLKTAYDESLPKSLSPAFLLREEELQYLFAQGNVCRMEYYGRVMDWHTKLTEQRRTLYHLTIYRWPLLKGLALRRQARTATPLPVASETELASMPSASGQTSG